jgi:hypothetical protein
MKKLTYLASAIATAFAANAYADVSVSGSSNVGYLSDVTGDGRLSIGSSVDFSLSTSTANGIGMSAGMSITVDQDADNGAAVGGGQSLTFTTGGATITVGDVELQTLLVLLAELLATLLVTLVSSTQTFQLVLQMMMVLVLNFQLQWVQPL